MRANDNNNNLKDFLDFLEDDGLDSGESRDEDDMTPEEELAFYRAFGKAVKIETMDVGTDGKLKPHQFSEHYENRLEDTLVKMYGKEGAGIILKMRRDGEKSRKEEFAAEFGDLAVKAVENGSAAEMPEIPAEPDKIIPADFGARTAKHAKKTKKFARFHKSTAFKIAAACAAVAVLSGVTISVDALRIPVARFFAQDKPAYTVLEVEPDTEEDNDAESYPDTIEKVFVPGKALDGYEEVGRESFSQMVRITYKNDEELEYYFYQETRDTSAWVDAENADAKLVETIFGNAYYSQKDNVFIFTWHYEGYIFRIMGNLSEENMVSIADSLKLEK